MFDVVLNSIFGLKKSRYLVFATIFFAFLSTFVECGIQRFLEENLDIRLARLVLSAVLTVITACSVGVLEMLLARCRSGFYLYGLSLETADGPHFVVGYFEVEYDAKTSRHRVDTALCFDCDDLKPGATLLNIAQPRAKWTADKIWISENHLDIVYNFERLGASDTSRAKTPNNYVGLMLLQIFRGLPRVTQYRGQVQYVQDSHAEASHDHHGYVYCEKAQRRGKSRAEQIAMIESNLRDEKARALVDAVAKVRNEKCGIVPRPRHTGSSKPELMPE